MSLSFSGYQTRTVRFQHELEASTGQVLGATARQAMSELPIPSLARTIELSRAELTGPRLDPESARERIRDAGLEGRLTVPEDGITDAALDILIERKREEIKRQEVLGRSPGGIGIGAAQLGTAFAASLLDPLNVGLAFVPVVGQMRYLRYLANARGALGRTGARAGVGAVEGAAGAAIIEPLVYGAKTHEQADYDFTDSLLNVAFGTVFGGGLHMIAGGFGAAARGAMGKRQIWEGLDGLDEDDIRLVLNFREDIASGRLSDPRDIARVLDTWTPQARKAIADAWPGPDSAAARVTEAPPAVREHALRTAVAQAIHGRRVDVEPIFPRRAREYVEKGAKEEGGDYTVREGELTDEQAALFASLRSDVQADEDVYRTVGGGRPAEEWARRTRIQGADGQPLTVYRGAAQELAPDHFDHAALGQSSGHPSSGLGVFFTADRGDAARYGPLVEEQFLDIRNPKVIPVEEIPALDALDDYHTFREGLRAEGFDGIVIDASHLGGPVQYVAFDPQQVVTRRQAPQLDEARASAERQASPDSDVTADVRASQAADQQLAEAPAGADEIAIQERLLAEELAELEDVARVAGVDLADELAEFDEAIANAETYGKAARAAALCGLGH